MNYRIERINSEMLKSISDIVRNRLKDPRVSEMISVVSVNVAKDLKTAKVIVSIFGDSSKIDSTFDALQHCSGYIRSELAHDFKELRCVPELRFVLDTSMDYSLKIDKILEEIKKNDNN